MIRTIFSAEYGDRNALISDSGEIITYSELTHIDISPKLNQISTPRRFVRINIQKRKKD